MTNKLCSLTIIPFDAPSVSNKIDLIKRLLKNTLVKGGKYAKREGCTEEGDIFAVDPSKLRDAADTYSTYLPDCPFYDFFNAKKTTISETTEKYFVAGVSFSFSRIKAICPFYNDDECTSTKKDKEPSLDDFLV